MVMIYISKVGFKPISTIMKKQNSIDSDGNKIDFMSKGNMILVLSLEQSQ